MTPTRAMPREPPCVKSLLRALTLLDVLAQSAAEKSLGELAQAANLPRSTTHRLLHSLQQKGYVAQNHITFGYALGDTLILLGRKAERQCDIRELARPWLERLARATHETVSLTRVVDKSVVQLDHIDSPNMLKVTWDSGQRFPIYASASGKVFLAYLPESERERVLKNLKLHGFTKNTIVDSTRMHAELQAIRVRGYALDDAEREEGVRCVAAPIFDSQGAVVAAVSISGPSLRLSLTSLHEFAGAVIEAASVISGALGYRA